jgi:hypothetical protein
MTTKTNTKTTTTDPTNNIDTDLAAITTVSGKIRYLNALGWKKGAIAKKLDKRYQHVRNVLLTPLKNQA